MINGRDIKSHDKSKLESYWNIYYAFANTELAAISEKELLFEVENAKASARPFVDSQVIIGNILTRLGNKHNFHRQFDEKLKHANKSQVLGMQLYLVMLKDELDWYYIETKHPGHLHEHATYFIPKTV